MGWTTEQQQVIDTRNKNILVSAAAGSGKTAVLVERIISLITDPADPVDIDSLLVLTFTNAAASEMKTRICSKLLEKSEADPDNTHLQAQLALIHNARITTIDGFCSYVVQNYGTSIGLDCGLRIAETGELKLLEKDSLKEFLESKYSEMTDDFKDFVETFAAGKDDSSLEDTIQSIASTVRALPCPDKWFEAQIRDLQTKTFDEIKNTGWFSKIASISETILDQIILLAEHNLEIARSPGGPAAYISAAQSDIDLFKDLRASCNDYEIMYEKVRSIKYKKLGNIKKTDVGIDEQLINEFKNTRDKKIKEPLIKKDLLSNYPLTPDEIVENLTMSSGPLITLLRLTQEYLEVFRKNKLEKGIMDFSDLEHYALRILVDETGKRTEIANELSRKYKAVMIDEYQDSNYLQEALLSAVTGCGSNVPNYFMVGDVKQSIYGFRQARPELFIQKYNDYASEDERNIRIDLHKNFRSRRQVLDATNFIFKYIMHRELGGIDYDDNAALYPGADYPDHNDEKPSINPFSAEIVCVNKTEELKHINTEELEARSIGKQIFDIVGKMDIYDKRSGRSRKAEFGDIVILVRSVKNWVEPVSQVLTQMNIPVVSEKKNGYFTTTEIRTLLSYLSILDNPRQDIPLAAVLHSPIVGLSNRELALIKAAYSESVRENGVLQDFWNALNYCASAEKISAAISKKIQDFLALYNKFRECSVYMPIDELIRKISFETGYYDYISSAAGGSQRAANVNMLFNKAADYEKTSYVGLTNFVRYIENLKEYSVDYGEANAAGDHSNTVRIMTIHGSKGLEFPVVILARMQHGFTMNDINKNDVLIHPDYGVASSCIDYERRIKKDSLRRTLIKNFKIENLIGEELRLLYVALTRAEQKLIMTGICDIKTLDAYQRKLNSANGAFPMYSLLKCRCCWDFVLPLSDMLSKASLAVVKVLHDTDLFNIEIETQTERELLRTKIISSSVDSVYDSRTRAFIDERFSFRYPYSGLEEIPSKVSVSELKMQHIAEIEESQDDPIEHTSLMFPEEVPVPLIPKFIKENEEKLSNTGRGTAYHNFLEHLDYSVFKYDSENQKILNANDEISELLGSQLSEIKNKGILTDEEYESIYLPDISAFVKSKLGIRMGIASANNMLFRERAFTFDVPASRVDPDYPESERILVQGIIDAYFFEKDEIVVVDYKTDRVNDSTGADLIEKYRTQIALYSDALERISGLKVKEQFFYSFALNKELPVPIESSISNQPIF